MKRAGEDWGEEEMKLMALLGEGPPPQKKQRIVGPIPHLGILQAVLQQQPPPLAAPPAPELIILAEEEEEEEPGGDETETDEEAMELAAELKAAGREAKQAATNPDDELDRKAEEEYDKYRDLFIDAVDELPFVGDELEDGQTYTQAMLREDLWNIIEDIFQKTGFRLALDFDDLLHIASVKLDPESQLKSNERWDWADQTINGFRANIMKLRGREMTEIMKRAAAPQ